MECFSILGTVFKEVFSKQMTFYLRITEKELDVAVGKERGGQTEQSGKMCKKVCGVLMHRKKKLMERKEEKNNLRETGVIMHMEAFGKSKEGTGIV
jgi:hypothetical protein